MRYLFLLCLSGLGLNVQASLLSDFLDQTETLSANFTQTSMDMNQYKSSEDLGRLFLQKPDQFFWQITEPFPQLILSNGQRLWMYDPELAQASYRDLNGSESATGWIDVLINPQNIHERFSQEETLISPGQGSLLLQARQDDDNLIKIHIEFDQGLPVKIETLNQLGIHTHIVLEDHQVNIKIDAEQFEFEPPPEIDVLENEAY